MARRDADAAQEGHVLVANVLENLAVIIHEVHLVYGNRDLAYAQHGHQIAMPLAVFLNAFFGIDDEHGGFSASRA